MINRIRRTPHRFPARGLSFTVLLAAALLVPGKARAQTAHSIPQTERVEGWLTVEGEGSFGNYKIFAQGENSKLSMSGMEYARHSWGYFMGSQVDYVGEFMPFVLLDEPNHLNYYGVIERKYPRSQQMVPGMGIAPIGIRFLWGDGRAIQPYFMVKGGILVFSQKAESPDASYENISLRSEIGMQIHLAGRTDLRLGLGDSHFSNLFVVPSNPGLDVMSYMFGISRHFGPRDRRPQ